MIDYLTNAVTIASFFLAALFMFVSIRVFVEAEDVYEWLTCALTGTVSVALFALTMTLSGP